MHSLYHSFVLLQGDQFATELPPYKDGSDKPSEGTWIVWTTTGTEEEANANKGVNDMDTEDAEGQADASKKKDKEKTEKMETDDEDKEECMPKEVYVTVFGTKGQSEPIPLVKGQEGDEQVEETPDQTKEGKSLKKDKGTDVEKKDKKQEDVKGKGKDQSKGGKDDKKGKAGKTDDKKGKEETEEEAVEDEVKKLFQPGSTDEFKVRLSCQQRTFVCVWGGHPYVWACMHLYAWDVAVGV